MLKSPPAVFSRRSETQRGRKLLEIGNTGGAYPFAKNYSQGRTAHTKCGTYLLAFSLAAALLDSLFEHPAAMLTSTPLCKTPAGIAYDSSFPAACWPWSRCSRFHVNAILARNSHESSSRNRAVAKRDRRAELRGREAYLKQYVDRPSCEPACLDAGVPVPRLVAAANPRLQQKRS